MNTQIHYNTIEEEDDMDMKNNNKEEEDTLSLSDLQIEDDNTTDSEEAAAAGSKPNQSPSSSSTSSSATSSYDEDFLGFFSEEWSRDLSYNNNNNASLSSSPAEDIIFCGKVFSSKQSSSKPSCVASTVETMNSQTRRPQLLLMRSASDSFRFMKTRRQISTPRSKSLPNRALTLPSRKWQQVFVFVFGLGSSGKFPTTMDMSDIKSRQLRRQTSSTVVTVSELYNQQEEKTSKSVGGRRRRSGWWRLVDVLGCSGGYQIDTSHHGGN